MLPEPIRESGTASPAPAEQFSNTENAPNTLAEQPREMAPAPSVPPAPSPAPTITPVPSQPQPNDSVPSAQAQASSPLIADDVDVIEKEWVEKAKKIVSSTKEDPHAQEKEVSKLQADYLMKRYNKKLKVDE